MENATGFNRQISSEIMIYSPWGSPEQMRNTLTAKGYSTQSFIAGSEAENHLDTTPTQPEILILDFSSNDNDQFIDRGVALAKKAEEAEIFVIENPGSTKNPAQTIEDRTGAKVNKLNESSILQTGEKLSASAFLKSTTNNNNGQRGNTGNPSLYDPSVE